MDLFNEVERVPKARKKAVDILPDVVAEATPASEFHDQVEAFYAIPQQRPLRNGDIRFSPSGVTKCAREQYYYCLDTPKDPEILTPWKQRVPRNGEGGHIVTQNDYMVMHDIMSKAGVPCKYRMLEVEKTSRKEFDVDGVKVVLNGRCDGILVDTETGELIIWEKKTKDKMTNFKKITEPNEANKAQAVCYSLLFGIPHTIFEYETLQKPQWSKDEDIDMKHFYFQVTPEMEKALLNDLAEIAYAIERRIPPPREWDKCMFCPYKGQCGEDGA